MDINLTLFGEMLTFAILIWATVKYVWPPILKAMQERQEKIAAGLAAAERSEKLMESARCKASNYLRTNKAKITTMLANANQQANQIIDASKITAQAESDKIIAKARLDIEQEQRKAQQELQQHTAKLVIAATEKLLLQKLDANTQQKLIDQFITEL